jgi:hypothetical protein
MKKRRVFLMKKLCIMALVILSSSLVLSVSAQEWFITYGIYYGKANDPDIKTVKWSEFDLMILHPGAPATDYENLRDPGFLMLIQSMHDYRVNVFLYLDVGCEEDYGGKYYSHTEKESWLRFKKKEIDTFMRFADGVFFDCIGPRHGRHVYNDQFGLDVQELVDYVHYSQGEVIIGNLWTMMEWVESGELDLVPYKADYVLIEGAWSMTPHQYSDDWNPLNALSFARSHDMKVLGLDFGDIHDEDRFMYCYCASRVFGFSGFYYASENDLYERINTYEVPDLGLPASPYTIEGRTYTRDFERGTVYVNLETHKGWITGEAAPEEAHTSVLLVVAGIVLSFFVRKYYTHQKE